MIPQFPTQIMNSALAAAKAMRSVSAKSFEEDYVAQKEAAKAANCPDPMAPYIGVAEGFGTALGMGLLKSKNVWGMSVGAVVTLVVSSGVLQAISEGVRSTRQAKHLRNLTKFEEEVFLPYIQEIMAGAAAFTSKEWEELLSSIFVGKQAAPELCKSAINHLRVLALDQQSPYDRIVCEAMADTLDQIGFDDSGCVIIDAATTLADADLILSCAAIKKGLFTDHLASFLVGPILKSGDARIAPKSKSVALLISQFLTDAWNNDQLFTVIQSVLLGNYLYRVAEQSDLNSKR